MKINIPSIKGKYTTSLSLEGKYFAVSRSDTKTLYLYDTSSFQVK